MKKVLVIAVSLLAGANYSVTARPVNTPKPVQYQVQGVAGFGQFNAHRQQAGVTLAWTYDSAEVISFTIQHSYDGFSFTSIAQVFPDASGRNKYHHEDPLPGYNYYRIVAQLPNGQEYSDIEDVRIVKRK